MVQSALKTHKIFCAYYKLTVRAVPQIIIKWDGEIRNENCINWAYDGLIVSLKYWYAKGKFSISNEETIYELIIKPIEKV